MSDCGRDIAALIKKNDIVFINGQMGSGKTTLTACILKNLGVSDRVSSPTYALAHSYQSHHYSIIHHLDCYRIKDGQGFYDLDLDFYLNETCIIEWPEALSATKIKADLDIKIIVDDMGLDFSSRTIIVDIAA